MLDSLDAGKNWSGLCWAGLDWTGLEWIVLECAELDAELHAYAHTYILPIG